jgi:hypothetical protein
MFEGFAAKSRLVWHVKWETECVVNAAISKVALNILDWHDLASSNLFCCCCHASRGQEVQSSNLLDVSSETFTASHVLRTLSLSPQTQAASSGAPGIRGSSFLVGNIVLFGSQGIVVAVLFIVKKSLTWVKRWLAVLFGSVMMDDTLDQ